MRLDAQRPSFRPWIRHQTRMLRLMNAPKMRLATPPMRSTAVPASPLAAFLARFWTLDLRESTCDCETLVDLSAFWMSAQAASSLASIVGTCLKTL